VVVSFVCVCVCVCVCICIYICVNLCIHIYIYRHAYICVYMQIFKYMFAHAYIKIRICIYLCIYIHTYTCMYIYTHVFMYAYIYIYMYIHTKTYVHVYMQIFTHIHTYIVQRGAASFVAQLRDTKENSDILVSLILTKEMLLVAKKPSYKTLYTLKYAGGLKVCAWMCVCGCVVGVCVAQKLSYRVATIGRLLKIIGRFCRISSLFKGSFAKETYNFKEPTSRSRPISDCVYPPVCWRPQGVCV